MAKSTFSEMARPGVCEVCGKNAPVVVCASAFGSVSFAYCKECLIANMEPYQHMVDYGSMAGEWPRGIAKCYQGAIMRIVEGHGKSEAEFAADVKAARAAF